MPTKAQKECDYCRIVNPYDFGLDDAWFGVYRENGAYCIKAHRGYGTDMLESEPIDYCPMCGRKLGEENRQ